MASLGECRVRSGALNLDNLKAGVAGVGKHRKEANLVGLEQKPVNGEHERALQPRLLRLAQLATHYWLGDSLDTPRSSRHLRKAFI